MFDPRPACVMTISTTPLTLPAPDTLPLVIVERKDLAHPDTNCDALVEAFSSGLARFCHDWFGAILRHNVDKALLCCSAARTVFGGGD